MEYKMCWLTLNHACNLRCKWCYAKSTNFLPQDNMPLEMAKEIVDFCKELNVNYIALIGGEPTIYPNLIEVIQYIHEKGLDCGIITNGIKFAEEDFVKNLINVDMKHFSLSLKGEDAESFRNVTGYDEFDTVKKGIKNCIKNNADVSVSMVLTEENIDTFIKGIKEMKEIGVKNFHFSFCYELETSKEYKDYLKTHNPKKLVKKFVDIYPELDELTEHRFTLFQGYPLCLWDKEVLSKMNELAQLTTVCQLIHRNGLIFDPQGYLIPCNAMPKIKLGRLHEEFNNAQELLEYTNKPEFINIYNKLCTLPSAECLNCDDLVNCGGGCVCQWSNYSYEQLIEMEE